MLELPAPLPIPPKTLIETLGPYAAGLLTLLGVGLTLLVTGRRERNRQRRQRADSYLREQRDLCSEVLAAAHRYNLAVLAFSRFQYWTAGGEERARAAYDELNDGAESFHSNLLRFRLLVQDVRMIDACDRLFESYSEASVSAGHVLDSFWSLDDGPHKWIHPVRHRRDVRSKIRRLTNAEVETRKKIQELQERAVEFHDAARTALIPDLEN